MKTWSFDNDKLFELVRCGRKPATCSVSDTESLSKPGDIEQIVNSKGEIIKIQITKVEIKRFCDIDEEWAKKEGRMGKERRRRRFIACLLAKRAQRVLYEIL